MTALELPHMLLKFPIIPELFQLTVTSYCGIMRPGVCRYTNMYVSNLILCLYSAREGFFAFVFAQRKLFASLNINRVICPTHFAQCKTQIKAITDP